eukprot:Skav205138  [mRNA]  locus=scaffold3411:165259:165997:- [translate_table: standard]
MPPTRLRLDSAGECVTVNGVSVPAAALEKFVKDFQKSKGGEAAEQPLDMQWPKIVPIDPRKATKRITETVVVNGQIAGG